MSHYSIHPEFFNKPILLTKEEMKEPLLVISDFFGDHKLSEIRNSNQQIDSICLCSDMHPFDNSTGRDWLLNYRKDEERLLEAAYLLLHSDAANLIAAQAMVAKKENGDPIDVDALRLKTAYLKIKILDLYDSIH